MARRYQLVVGASEAGQRLDHYLVRHVPSVVSRSMIQRGIRSGVITVGQRPSKVHYRLHAGDVVAARFDELPAPTPNSLVWGPAISTKMTVTPQPIPLDVVYEDEALLVVNKPAGLVTHPAPGHWDGTLVNGLLWHFMQGRGTRDTRQGTVSMSHVPCPMSPLLRAGIVHRLDKDTSGLLLVAKTPGAHVALAKQMKARAIKRRYLALVEGHVPLDHGTISAAIGRHSTHRKEMTVRHLGGRDARTHYRVLRRSRVSAQSIVHSPWSMDKQTHFLYTVLELHLDTGRTHQIRVHMAHLGYPVVGDTTYGKRSASVWQELSVSRQLLHAYQLSFRHPVSGSPLTLTCSPPPDMAGWVGEVRVTGAG